MTSASPGLALAFDLAFDDLYRPDGLARVDDAFCRLVHGADPALAERFAAARRAPDALAPRDESALIIALAPYVDRFVAALFGIEAEVAALTGRHHALAPLFACKRLFVQRRAAKQIKPAEAAAFDGDALAAALAERIGAGFDELAFATAVQGWCEDEAAHAEALELALKYAAWALYNPAGRARHGGGLLFQVPEKHDPTKLIEVETVDHAGLPAHRFGTAQRRPRQGFALTDPGTDLAGALDQANYCIWCHNQGKDSCARGLRDRKTGAVQVSPLGVKLAGCPLEEKISEMHVVKSAGVPIGALAVITIDNPMCPATGHRICNDCMKSCIYQKQQPVDIPQAETRTLKDVLALPWGVEIYGLLTRWNPLNLRRPLPKAASGYKVLVVGLGPAGFTLSHHLLNDGHAVVAIDGLKIEPLAPALSGVDARGGRVPFRPVRDFGELVEPLDARVMAGFGGVAEYGITVRWDKNFLKLIRLMLERRAEFTMIGGVRFGGTLTVADAFAAGFDHIALCAGAGRPTVLRIPNGLAPGVRQASDFLMALQLTGAARADTLANLEIQLPVVVIGGGLTAVDTATEALAYYPIQVERFLARYETLVAERGEDAVRAGWTARERETADRYLAHARALRAEAAAATAAGRAPRTQALLEEWGGATIVYRRRITEAPSYTLNHEEVAKAFEEGIRLIEQVTPTAVEIDRFGHAEGLRLARPDGVETVVPARTVLVAAGTQPNTVLAREDNPDGLITLDGKYYQAFDETGAKVTPERLSKPSEVHVVMARHDDGRAISFWGDLHPSFAGNVVKAMGGAKQGYPVVSRVVAGRPPTAVAPDALAAEVNRRLRARVHAINRLTPTIVEVVIDAPQAAGRFEPGQFYRLQNFETLAPQVAGTRLAMEGLALTGASVDLERGLLSTIVLEMGGSSDLCALLKPGEPVVLMGPTGTPTEIPTGGTVCLVGGGLGNAVLFSIGAACRARGARVLYFAGYKKRDDRYKVEQIERAADRIVWCCDEAPGFAPSRTGDRAFVGNIVEAMRAYGAGLLGPADPPLGDVDRIIAIGSDRMMAAVAAARHGVLAPYLKDGHLAIGSINSPMQCMMKEICAQCLQLQRDPETGEETVVFSCFNQDQPLDRVDFGVLRDRLTQNAVQEKLTAQWIDRCLKLMAVRATAV